jgi:hypothetical protein
MKSKMVKNKSKLAIKLFIIVWIVLAVHIALKLTFNYWQPYVIPNEQLQTISDFIDSHSVIKIGLNGIWYIFNGYIMLCCGLQCWHLGKRKSIITLIVLILGFLWVVFIETTIITLLLTIVYPLILNHKKWLTIILTFCLTNVFLFLSLWFEGFVTADNMNYAVRMFLQFDYYIMLALNYFVFNLIRKKE